MITTTLLGHASILLYLTVFKMLLLNVRSYDYQNMLLSVMMYVFGH